MREATKATKSTSKVYQIYEPYKSAGGSAFAELRQTTKGVFEGAARDSMALIHDATKALEAEGAIIERARDEANDRMKSIIIKGQAERAGAQKLRGSLKRGDG